MASRRQRMKMKSEQTEESKEEKLDSEHPELITYNIQPHNVSMVVKWDFNIQST